jgi:hypothetical protein
MKYFFLIIAIFVNNAFSATYPPMNISEHKRLCDEEFTKKGVIDQRMVTYCIDEQQKGYQEVQFLIKKFENQKWIQDAVNLAINEWTKKGLRNDRMVAHSLTRITDGFEELVLAYKKPGFNQSKYDACFRNWGVDFNMVWYCYKEL